MLLRRNMTDHNEIGRVVNVKKKLIFHVIFIKLQS
jgi:hypothetical protein